MKMILWLAISILLFIFGIRYLERHSIYFPMKEISETPSSIGLEYEDISFETSDGKRLHGWFIPSDEAHFTLIFCHGNAGNISHRISKISMLRDLGLNVFIFDYRGYGKSEGAPSESGLYNDAMAAYKYVVDVKRIPKSEIILYGESIGGAVVIDLAHKADLLAFITEEAFSSTKDMVRLAYPFLPHFIFASRFDSITKIKDMAWPKLIIHSVDDEIVPFEQGQRLFNAARPPKKFLKLRGSHNTAFLDSREEYEEGLRDFVKDLY